MTPQERAEALERISGEVRNCTSCRLHRGRTKAVPGEGHPDTEVVFVGEGPGQNEDQQGRPFVGAAGGLLEELLAKVGWRRDEVFITNVVKCRPPGNRDPEPDEIAACSGFLRRQLEILDPAVVVTLGRFSLGTFMPGAKISSAHGTVRAVDPATGASSAVAFAMYHPAAAFRQANLRETLVADMANLPQVLLEARAARELDARRAREARAGDAKGDVATDATPDMEDGSTDAEVLPAADIAHRVEPEPSEDGSPAVTRADAGGDGLAGVRRDAVTSVDQLPPLALTRPGAGHAPDAADGEPLPPPAEPAPAPTEAAVAAADAGAPSRSAAEPAAEPPVPAHVTGSVPRFATEPAPLPPVEPDDIAALSDLATSTAIATAPSPDEEPNDQMTLF